MQIDLIKEEEIIAGCQRGERRYQQILYQRFSPKMYGICLSYAGNRQLAQDMLHDAFIKVFHAINDFKTEGSLEGWIRRIVTNAAIDQLRRLHRIDHFIAGDTEEMKVIGQHAEVTSHLGTQEILRQVARLPDGARAIFNLFALEGFTHKEIASRLKISEGTSKSQYKRARTLLMQWVEKP